MEFRTLKDKVAVVTGGGRGLGEAICDMLSAEGAIVAVADVRAELAEEVTSRIRRGDNHAMPLQLDVSRCDDAKRALDAVAERYGRIDVLVNNAGINVTLPIEELCEADWDRILAVNLSGPFYMAKHALAHMRRGGGGHIVNIVSTAAKRAWPNAAAYHASKWGLLGLSHAMHVEARKTGVKVTAVIAGGMRTPFLLDAFPDIDVTTLQDSRNVADTVKFVLLQKEETVVPEIMVLPMRETSWP